MEKTRTIQLPEAVCQAAEQRFSHRFGTLEELIAVLLTELVQEEALRMDEHEERVIQARLRGLGYI